ncbi:MAG: hypothetical protein AAB300_00880, partial [Nitrospirota bacterium]
MLNQLKSFNKTIGLILIIFVVSGCGGYVEGDDNRSSDKPVAKIEIEQTDLLLSNVGDSKTLSAKAYDDQGNRLNAPIQWSSTK